MKVFIPFHEDMAFQILAGRKTCTSRNKRYGNPGDTFNVRDETEETVCELTEVKKEKLQTVAYEYYRAEGFNSVEGFVDKWNEIHPRKGYQPLQEVWLHIFKLIEQEKLCKD